MPAVPGRRTTALAEAGFNPLKLACGQVDFDLKTDSWAQLRLPAIGVRMQQLQAHPLDELEWDRALRGIFPFQHFVLADSGRSAEQALYRAWPRKGRVLQNLLFPSNLYHQIDNGFDPRELPSAALFDLQAHGTDRGELDLAALAAQLDSNAGQFALACVEVANNAAGGAVVGIEHLRRVKALLAPYSIPLAVDATRVVDNAMLASARSGSSDVWTVVGDTLACADVVVASLAKNFGVDLGGVIATNDEALWRAARSAVEQAGTGLDAFERTRIAAALQDRRFITAHVGERIDAVRAIWNVLAEQGVPVVDPPGGHCVLIDVKRLDAFASLPHPVASFLAWLYLNTGIRAGAHSAGMQRRSETKGLVRLAVPLGLGAAEVAEIARRLGISFARLAHIPELVPVDPKSAGFGELTAEYRLERYHRASAAVGTTEASTHGTAAAVDAGDAHAATTDAPPASDGPTETDSAQREHVLRGQRRPCDIAIVGMAGRYPKARTIGELWENLRQGRECIEDLPDDRLAQRLRYGPAARYRGGFIDDVDKFDSLFFNIPPKDAERLDPQERLFAEVAWEALEDAGYFPEALGSSGAAANVGVYVGAVWACYQTVGVDEKRLGGTQAPSSFLWGIANRVSYAMNFCGPSLTIDTACSSSLTALYLACEALEAGECSAAIVGGVNLDLHQSKWDINLSGGALSKDGVCRSFGQGANGYVAGEGVGAVFIKPLEQAVADGDQIYGVIKSVVVNHGGRTSGFVVPNPKAQAALIKAALERAHVDAASIDYVEAHGTGTELGDPLEISALTSAFAGAVPKQSCPVGSLKSNIGHLEAAAGIASLSKVLLQMKHRALVPSLHSTVLNEHIDFANSPFRVPQQLEPWPSKQVDGVTLPLRAGISSFGAGGSNAHVIIESFPRTEAQPQAAGRDAQVFPLSARNEAQLNEVAVRLRDFLRAGPDAALGDIAFTLQIGRKPFEWRVALVARSQQELIERIDTFLAGKKHAGIVVGHVKNADVIVRHMNRVERDQMIGLLSRRRDPARIARLWADGVLLDWRGVSAASAGQRISLPTYPFADKRHWVPLTSSATVASAAAAVRGIHPLVDSNESTFERQLFKKTFHEGEFFIYDHRVMAVPTLPGVAFLELARKSGELAAARPVRRIRNVLWVSPIAVHGAVPAETWIELKPSGGLVQFEVFSNASDGRKVLHSQGKLEYASAAEIAEAPAYVDLEAIKARCAKVRDGVDAYPMFKSFGLDLGASFQSLQEVFRGDGETLGRLQLPPSRADDLGSLMLHPSLVDGALQAGVAAQLGSGPAEMLVPFSIGEVEVLHPLPAACWSYVTESGDERVENSRVSRKDVLILDEDGRILVRIREATGVPIAEVHKTASAPRPDADYAELFYAPEWIAAAPLASDAGAVESAGTLLLFAVDDELRIRYRGELAHAGLTRRIVLVKPGAAFSRVDDDTFQVDPAEDDGFARLLDALGADAPDLRQMVFAWPLHHRAPPSDAAALADSLTHGVYAVLSLCRALATRKAEGKLQLVYAYAPQENDLGLEHEAMAGFFRALHLEFPKLHCRTLALAHDCTTVVEALRAELAEASDAVAVRVVAGERQLRRLKAFELPVVQPGQAVTHGPRRHGVYLITGGLGGLGLVFAEFLARNFQARLLLTGRSQASPQQEARVAALRALGAEVVTLAADVSVRADVERMVAAAREHFGEIHGVIHSAGVLRDSYVRNKTHADFAAVLAPKVQGTRYLDEFTRDQPLDFFVLFSSMAAIAGNAGQSDYGYANHFMDSFAFGRERLREAGARRGKTLSLNWSLWADGGMRVDEQTEQLFTRTLGLKLLSTAVGVDAFIRGLASSATQLAVLEGNQEKIETVWGLRKKPPAAAPTPAPAAAPDAATDLAARVQDELTRMAMAFLKLDADDIAPDSVLLDLGFDSIGLTTYSNDINGKYGVEVTPVLFFDYPSIRDVARYLATECSAEVARVHAVPAAAGMNAPAANAPTPTVPAAPASSINKGWDPHAVDAAPQAHAMGARPANRFVDMPIAIVGMSGVMPQSADLDEFWAHLRDGRDLITEIPEDRWDWREFYGDPFKEANKSNSKWGGFMKEVDRFDALFFGISKREAQMMDPQQRIFLETVWKAIEDSGHRVSDLSGTRTGLFVGVATNDYVDVMNRLEIDLDGYSASGNSHSVLANRVSFLLNLRGPSAPIDTACSSSLVALHRAIESIHTGSCDMAIVGGVQVMLSPAAYISFGMAGMLSSDGKCKTFDKRANGYVRGEGAGAILLKPLDRAEADGDHVYAVIRATAENHGGRVTTLTAPNSAAQTELLIEAYEKAQFDPGTVGYVECHGTGTSIGDPIEIQALGKAFGELYKRHGLAPAATPHIGLSSAKTNIGHLETAAGIAGILRALLAIRHRQIPANVHFEELNPYINLSGTPFYVADTTRDWPAPRARDGRALPRRAGVSSFGFGGANAHIVLEEYPDEGAHAAVDAGPQLVVLSAKTPERLGAYVESMLQRVERGGLDLVDLAYTLQVGRDEMGERAAFVATSLEELRGGLRAFLNNEDVPGAWRGSSRKQADPAAVDRARTALEARDLPSLAELWVRGAAIDWAGLPRPRAPRRLSLPTYPFARERFWIPGAQGFRRSDAAVGPAKPKAAPPSVSAATVPAQTLYFCPEWQPAPLLTAGDGRHGGDPLLLLADDETLRESLRRRFAAHGTVPRIVRVQSADACRAVDADTFELRPTRKEDWAALLSSLPERGARSLRVVHAWALGEPQDDGTAPDRSTCGGVHSLLALLQAFDELRVHHANAELVVAHVHRTTVDAVRPQHAAVASFLATAVQEMPSLTARCVLLDDPAAVGPLADAEADALIAELDAPGRGSTEVRYRAQQRSSKRLKAWTPPTHIRPPVREGGSYLISGGAGGIGLIVAGFLASQARVQIALVGRSQLDAEQQAKVASLEAQGAQVIYLRGDIGNHDDAFRVLAETRARFGRIHGIVHAAGVLRDAGIRRKQADEFDLTCAPKLQGTRLLDLASQADDLDFFVMFSSIAALGSAGQCDYAYANGFQLHFATWRQRLVAQGLRRGRSVAIGWPMWQDAGMRVEPARRSQLEASGLHALDTDAGLAAFAAALGGDQPQLLVMHGERGRIERLIDPTVVAHPANSATALTVGRPGSDALKRLVRNDLLALLGQVLLVDPGDIAADRPMTEYGLDSIGVADLFRRLNASYPLDVAPSVIFEYPTVDAFCGYLLAQHGEALGALHAEAFAATRSQAAAPPPTAAVVDRPAEDHRGTPGSQAEVAIIGIAGVFPGADTPAELWRHLLAGTDLVSEVLPERWVVDAGDARWGGFLRNVDRFDADFFGISPLEAALMDPQQRLFLQVAWNAIEDAGHRPSALAGSRTGVFAGLGGFDYLELLRDAGIAAVGYSATGMAHCVLPNRVSYLLDLHGPSEAIDTACSSSLVAVHRAVESIVSGTCTQAIAGGTNLLLTPSLQRALGAAGMLAADGRCKTFDERADGYVRGEGCAAVLLKRLDLAVADGDAIYAVVKGSGVNHGGRAMALTAPNPVAQAELLVDVYRRAQVDPAQVGLIETHGTGTAMGDAVEFNGMSRAFNELARRSGRAAPPAGCALGATKTHIGHLEAASGIASLIAALLAIGERRIPGVRHLKALNPQIRIDGSPFRIPRETQEWTAVNDASGRPLPLTAGVSSLGFGGVNAHVILQQHVADACNAGVASAQAESLARMIVLSARTPDQLHRRMTDLLLHLRSGAAGAALTLAGLAYTLQTGREGMRERIALRVDSLEELIDKLEAVIGGERPVSAVFRSRGERDADGISLINRDAELKGTIVSRWLERDEIASILELWSKGVDIDWRALYGNSRPGRIHLPTYPFAGERHWIDTVEAVAARAAGAVVTQPVATDGDRIPAHAADTAALIRQVLATQLGCDAAQLAEDRTLLDLGVSSLGIAALVAEINRRLGLDLLPSVLFEHPTIGRLALFLDRAGSSHRPTDAGAGVEPCEPSPPHTIAHAPSRDAHELLQDIAWREGAMDEDYERLTF